MTVSDTNLPKVLRVCDIAEAAMKSDYTVQKWLRDGRFPNAFKLGTSNRSEWRIPYEDVAAFLRGEAPPNARNRKPRTNEDMALK